MVGTGNLPLPRVSLSVSLPCFISFPFISFSYFFIDVDLVFAFKGGLVMLFILPS